MILENVPSTIHCVTPHDKGHLSHFIYDEREISLIINQLVAVSMWPDLGKVTASEF
jgi:hypothetical protein